MATAILSNEEQARLRMAESASLMASTDFWKALVEAMKVHEQNALVRLDQYLEAELHPDREEVMTLCLHWHALRAHLRLLLENVRQARDWQAQMKDEVLGEFMANPEFAPSTTTTEGDM